MNRYMERFSLPHTQPFAAARQIACRIRTYGITLVRLYAFPLLPDSTMVMQWLCLMGPKAGASTKNSTHHRRARCERRKLMLNISTNLQLKMNDFLSNKDNKQWFPILLGGHLATRGCEIAYSIGSGIIRHLRISTDGWWQWPACSPDSCWWKQA